MKAILYLLSLIAACGLLLGVNVKIAIAQTTTAATTQDIAAQVAQIRQRIIDLTGQMPSAEASSISVSLTPPTLSQAQLDAIQTQVNQVAIKTAQIKIEVEAVVVIREIKEKIVRLQNQLSSASEISVVSVQPETKTAVSAASSSPESAVSSVAASAAVDKQAVEAQIDQIKQKIAELKQKQLDQASVGEGTTCSGSSCSVTSSGQPSASVTAVPASPASQSPAKSLWQSIGEFFKKIFTF
jgi:hypothetical protein